MMEVISLSTGFCLDPQFLSTIARGALVPLAHDASGSTCFVLIRLHVTPGSPSDPGPD